MARPSSPDVIIIGSGVGGGTTAYQLASQGAHVLLLERGEYIPREDDNWNAQAVYIDKKYNGKDTWLDGANKPFTPNVFYNVGGATKFFGCTMIRFRERDFETVEHFGGLSPAWPISYAELEPYYGRAEALFHTMGEYGVDPTDPPRSTPYPFPGVKSDKPMAELVQKLRQQGLKPYSQHAAIHMPPNGGCTRCDTCDGYPCKIDAKADAEKSVVRPALATGRVELRTGTLARRLMLAANGKEINGVEVERGGRVEVLTAKIYIVSASAINSAALLLRSATDQAPNGVSNSSGLVGRNYMAHNNSAMMAVSIAKNETVFQKSVAINDFYYGDDDFKYPMGCIMSLGKLKAGVMTASIPWLPQFANRALAERSYDWWIMSEDLPDPDNRVTIDGGMIKIVAKRTNMRPHQELKKRAARAMRRAGLPLILTKQMTVATTSHQCGTVRFGNDPKSAALDPFCRSYNHKNLFVVDASFFPSSAAVNPALTIAAQALRVSEHIMATEFEAQPAATSITKGTR